MQISLLCWGSVSSSVNEGLLKSFPALNPVNFICLDILGNQAHIIKILISNTLLFKRDYAYCYLRRKVLDGVHRTLRSAITVLLTLNKFLWKKQWQKAIPQTLWQKVSLFANGKQVCLQLPPETILALTPEPNFLLFDWVLQTTSYLG